MKLTEKELKILNPFIFRNPELIVLIKKAYWDNKADLEDDEQEITLEILVDLALDDLDYYRRRMDLSFGEILRQIRKQRKLENA